MNAVDWMGITLAGIGTIGNIRCIFAFISVFIVS